MPPPNDRLYEAEPLMPGTTRVTQSTQDQTAEWNGYQGVWFLWTAPASMLAEFTTMDSNYDTMLMLYRADTVPPFDSSQLVLVGENDDDASTGSITSRLAVEVVEGTTYALLAAGYAGDSGTLVLNYPDPALTFEPAPAPAPEPLPEGFTGGFSTRQIELWLDDLQATDIWLGLLDDDPFSVGDPLSVELSSGGYARPKVLWSRPGPKLLRVGGVSQWTGLDPGSSVRAIGGFDAATNGAMRFAVFSPRIETVGSGGIYTVPADSLYVGLDV